MSMYYYLTASLPFLNFGVEANLSVEKFLYECKKWLTDNDLRAVKEALASELEQRDKDPEVLKKWKRFDGELKEKLAAYRASKRSGTSGKTPPGLKEIVDADNPLEAEKAFEKMRWDFLDAELTGHQFDINWLILYALKVRIAERLNVFDKDKGDSIFYNLCEVIYEKAQR